MAAIRSKIRGLWAKRQKPESCTFSTPPIALLTSFFLGNRASFQGTVHNTFGICDKGSI